MDPNTAVTGEENIYFEMESRAEIDGYDDVVDTYDEVVQVPADEILPPVPKRTSCETCMETAGQVRQALSEIENVCRSNTVIIRRTRYILAATVAVLLTAIAILILVILMMMRSGAQVCGPVGVEDRNTILDDRMTASTFFDSNVYPYYGRLNGDRGNGAWCTKTESNRTEYLQVDIGEVHSLCAVATQGEKVAEVWTTSYKVHLSIDGVTWNAYRKEKRNSENVFPGNTDQKTIVKHSLSSDVRARFVRFYPVTYRSYDIYLITYGVLILSRCVAMVMADTEKGDK